MLLVMLCVYASLVRWAVWTEAGLPIGNVFCFKEDAILILCNVPSEVLNHKSSAKYHRD